MKNHPDIVRDLAPPQNEQITEEHEQKSQACQKWLGDNLLSESRIHQVTDYVDQELLKKYIIYSRRHCHPKLNEIDKEKVT